MTEEVPDAVPRGPRRISVIWLVPAVAAIVTIGILYTSFWDVGPTITIFFQDGSGIRSDQTILQYRGVKVGDVKSIRLGKDQNHVVVEARLDPSADGLAREGSRFWIVRPEIGMGGVRGLETLVSGPYIECSPGGGGPHVNFVGEKRRPISHHESGLKIVLTAPNAGSLKSGTPVFYRGVQVGRVQDNELADDARRVNIHILIEDPYTALVRRDSKFWNISGVNVALGLMGLKINMPSLETAVGGGVAFATPDGPGEKRTARQNMIFELHDKPNDEWLKWSPSIKLEKMESGSGS